MNTLASPDRQRADDQERAHIISHTTSYRVKSRSEILALLNKLEKQHTLLSITLSDNAKTFGSMILEINSEKNYLVLDELYPRNELKKSLLHDALSIDTHLDGIEISFKVQVRAIADRDEVEYYKVSFPASVFHHQRRNSYRVNIGVAAGLQLALSTENDVLLHAELRDISLGGISARLNSPQAEMLSVGEEIPTCIIHAPDGRKIVCSLEIARIEPGTPAKSTRIGARFIDVAATDRHALARLIAKMDRENIKKLKRLTEVN